MPAMEVSIILRESKLEAFVELSDKGIVWSKLESQGDWIINYEG